MSADAAAPRRLNHSIPMYIHTGDTIIVIVPLYTEYSSLALWIDKMLKHANSEVKTKQLT